MHRVLWTYRREVSKSFWEGEGIGVKKGNLEKAVHMGGFKWWIKTVWESFQVEEITW